MLRRVGGVAAVGVLAVSAACGVLDNDVPALHDSENPVALEPIQIPGDPGPGCGDVAATDPADLRTDRIVARCGPGAPGPDPLSEPATVRVALREPSEDMAPVLLADRMGEFAEENLSVELEFMDPVEAFEALANGEVDAVAGDMHAAFLDMVTEGDGARLVLGGPVPATAGDTSRPQAGLWIEPGALERPEQWSDLNGKPVAVEDGIWGAPAYPIMVLLTQRLGSLNHVQLVFASGDEAADRLLGGELAAAWLETPHWRPVAARGAHQLVATRPPVESLGGMVFGERLLDMDEERDVGVAFSRAIIRTINTYLAGDYWNDPDVMAALSEVTGLDDGLLGDPPLVHDWELRQGTLERIQEEAFIPLGAVVFEQTVDEDRFVDRSLYEDAIDG
jgi:NitT/TauT family transport system substrate-binding protein